MELDQDTQQLIRLLDAAVTSDNPGVKDALRALLVITALTEQQSLTEGPYASLVREFDRMVDKVSGMQRDISDIIHYIKRDQERSYGYKDRAYGMTAVDTYNLDKKWPSK